MFEKCVEADGPGGEQCTKEELEEYGDIYVQMVGYIQKFFNETAFPAVTSDWEETTKDWFGGRGWTWDGVAARVLKDYYYLAAWSEGEAIKKSDRTFLEQYFESYIFFAPLINSVGDSQWAHPSVKTQHTHEIYIVPMSIPSRLGNLTKDPGYKKLMINVL